MENKENRLQHVLSSHPAPVYTTAAVAISLFALGPSPSFIPLILTLSTLRITSRIIAQQESTLLPTFLLWLSLTISTSLTYTAPSLSALSTSASTIVYLLLLSSLTSALALVPIFLDTTLRIRLPSTSSIAQPLLFPALWASTWCLVSHFSPLGRLLTWSPVQGLDAYMWLRPYLGPVGIDWVVGAWAVGLSDIASIWVTEYKGRKAQVAQLISVGSVDTDTTPQEVPTVISSRTPTHVGKLVCLLGLLTIPSFISPNLPLPANSSTTAELRLACALPITKDKIPSLDDYIKESLALESRSDIILWPESAVRFSSQKEKEDAFVKIQTRIHGQKLIVAGFEGYTSSAAGRPGMYDNGLIMINKVEGVVMEYHKRHLVPIVEPYSIIPSFDPPQIYNLPLITRGGTNKHPRTQLIPLTASICLDFAHPAPFSTLPTDTRPALILAPAKTWHTSIGLAMYEQAKARAEEIQSTLVWCDGGAGGISGIVSPGDGRDDIVQVGPGSWVRNIGIEREFDDQRRTIYAHLGDWASLAILLGLSGLGAVAGYGPVFGMIVQGGHDARRVGGNGMRWIGMGAGRLLEMWRERRVVMFGSQSGVDAERQEQERRPLLE